MALVLSSAPYQRQAWQGKWHGQLWTLSHRKSVFSLNEVGQMNGTAGGAGAGSGGGGSDDGEMPEVHEIGEELAWTGR